MLKEFFKQTDKEFIQLSKKLKDFNNILDKLEKKYKEVMQIKSETQISKKYLEEVKIQINKTKILDNVDTLYKEIDELNKKLSELKTKIKETKNFLEKFRTTRIYQLNEKQIYRFLSGFLENYSEYFYFKPEFIGVIDLDEMAKELKGKKEYTKLKLHYESLPKAIKYAYDKKLKNFVIESHNLKMLFLENYKIKITTENKMIRKIDKIAKEIGIEFI